MLRVYATMQKTNQEVRSRFQSQMAELASWAREIVEATASRVVSLSHAF